MPWPQIGATHYHEHIWLLAKGQRVGCLMGVTYPNTPGVSTEKERYGSPLVVGPDVKVSWTAVSPVSGNW